jgi:DNA-binding CsgD family transcriptional regulator
MLPSHKTKPDGAFSHSSAYPLDESHALSKDEHLMALLALSHTPAEHQLYEAMLAETRARQSRTGAFSIRRMMELTGLSSYSMTRRSREGLLQKLSIESPAGEDTKESGAAVYLVYSPEEIFARRQASGQAPYPKEAAGYEENTAYSLAIERVIRHHNLSRREAQVTLLCAQGLTNAGIGRKLNVTEQTVKFHLRHIFVKFGVRRRAELISHLLMHDGSPARRDFI